jgi:ATP-dependent Clp protease ATP-binding subunit ClpC
MPKINVYLPADLAAAVRAAGFPVSPVCQRALAEAVRSADKARAMIDALRDPGLTADRLAELAGQAGQGLTKRLGDVLEQAVAAVAAGAERGQAGTGEVLASLLDNGENMGVRILQALEVDLDDLRAAIDQAAAVRAEEGQAGPGQTGGEGSLLDMTLAAREAVASATETAVGLGHNYVGCEHMLLGLLAGRDSVAGRALAAHKVTEADARRALIAAIAGYAHGRQAAGPTGGEAHEDLRRRLEAVERRLAAIGG